MRSLPQSFCRLLQSRSGTVGIMFGLMAVPLFLAVGAGVDYTRAVQFRTALQNASDNAAVAGASVFTASSDSSNASTVATSYMNAAIARLPSNSGVTFNVTPVSGSNGNTVQVSVQGSTKNLITSLFMKASTVSVSATAENPVVSYSVCPGVQTPGQACKASASAFSSSAADRNSVYWYYVPANGSVPQQSDLHLLYSNASSSSETGSQTVPAMGTQQVGIALENITGGNDPAAYSYSSCSGSGRHQTCTTQYNTNQYGSTVGQTNWFYSQLNPPSLDAYTNASKYDNQTVANCSLQVLDLSQTKTVSGTTESYNYETSSYTNGPVSGQCFSSPKLPLNNTLTCSNLGGQNFEFAWNDMGGTSDDRDYNDAVFTFSCGGTTGTGGSSGTGSTSPTGVVLIN